MQSTASGEWGTLAFPLRILSGVTFLELSAAFPANSQVCSYKEFIFPRGQIRPCPFSDVALGHQWGVGSLGCSQERGAPSAAPARGPSPSAQFHCFPRCPPHQGLGGLGPQLALLLFRCSCIMGCKTFTCRCTLILAAINSHSNSLRSCSASINGKVNSSLKQPGSSVLLIAYC